MIPFPQQKFQVIYADPPWDHKTWSDKGYAGRPQHYQRMSLDDICRLPVADLADKNCWLFLWATAPHLEQALQVIKAWGFDYSSIAFTWVKLIPSAGNKLFITAEDLHRGMGYTTIKNSELCLLSRRGRPKRISGDVKELLIDIRREHSRKPDEAYNRIEQFAQGPFIELFARQTRDGWTSWGNETDKFNE